LPKPFVLDFMGIFILDRWNGIMEMKISNQPWNNLDGLSVKSRSSSEDVRINCLIWPTFPTNELDSKKKKKSRYNFYFVRYRFWILCSWFYFLKAIFLFFMFKIGSHCIRTSHVWCRLQGRSCTQASLCTCPGLFCAN
jgi:hypothetical protein